MSIYIFFNIKAGSDDFLVEVLTASFAPGDTEACVEFVLLDDALALEGDETFTTSFEPPAGTNPGASTTVSLMMMV